jgi:PAS domain S-box-containing protein
MEMETEGQIGDAGTSLQSQGDLLPVSVEALVPLCSGLICIYGLLIPLHLLQLEGRAGMLMALVDGLLVAFFLAQRQALLKGGISRRQVRVLAAADLGLPYLSVLLLFLLKPDPTWTGFVLVILIGSGAFLLSLRWFVVAGAAISVSWVSILVLVMPGGDGLQLAAVLLTSICLAAAVFVSRRRNLLAGLERERALGVLSRAVEQSSSVVLITNPEGNITYVNPKFTEVTGYEAGEVDGRNPRILKSGETSPDVYSALWNTLERGDAWHGEFKNITKSGEPYWALASISPMLDDEGHVVSYVGVQEDITARKKAEEALVGSQRLEAVGRLVSGIAHDFNNLLTSILGFSEIAASELGEESAACRPYLEQVTAAGETAASLTGQLLAVGRQQVLRPQTLDLNAEIVKTEELLDRTLGEDVEVVMSLDPEVGQVRADPGQLQQVLLNLAVNARDAMPTGGVLSFETSNVVIEDEYLSTHLGAQAGSFVMLAVSDSGCGMNSETLKHIFEPFFTTKKGAAGTGLGLATTYGIIKQSGGYIWAYSEPEKGSTFKIYMPRCDAAVETRSPGVALPGVDGNETILLVEDEDRIRELLSGLLAKHGYTVLGASCSEDAVRLATGPDAPIDLLVADLVLPTDNGLRLAERLCRERNSLKVLLMTGYAEKTLRRKHALDPKFPLLTKPFSMRAFLRTVREVLDGPLVAHQNQRKANQ